MPECHVRQSSRSGRVEVAINLRLAVSRRWHEGIGCVCRRPMQFASGPQSCFRKLLTLASTQRKVGDALWHSRCHGDLLRPTEAPKSLLEGAPILVQYRTEFLLSKCVGTIPGRVFKTPRRFILSRACSGSSSSWETALPGPKGLASQVVARASTIVRPRPVSESAGGVDGGPARPSALWTGAAEAGGLVLGDLDIVRAMSQRRVTLLA